ncbi:hypothetical protein DFH27DRAFT_604519 [Peziza echinospora]|nr:hypothetical protein DFH27DRAFT_604519 [Peziza echinospora]
MRLSFSGTSHIAILLALAFYCSAQLLVRPLDKQQQLPHTFAMSSTEGPDADGAAKPMLSDVISIDRGISIFSGFTRSVGEVGIRLEDQQKNTTVLAPSNSVITSLPRKPWENPKDESDASAQGVVKEELYRGESGEERAADNLRRFVEAHLVGISPWEKGKENSQRTLEGKVVWWDEENGVRKIYPDGIEVDQVKNDVTNGQIWIIKGVINY